MNGGIYRILCIPNKHFYVGRTMKFDKRVKDHLRELRKGEHKNQRLQHCFNKYGEENIKFDLIIPLPDDEYIHREVEQMMIDEVIHMEECLNINETAGGGCVVPMTEERKHKIRLTKIGERNPLYGKKRVEFAKKISGLMKGRILSEETKRKISESHKGKELSEEHKEKLRKALSGSNNPQYGKKSGDHPASKAIVQIDMDTLEVIAEYQSVKDVERLYGYDSSSVTKVCKGKLKQIYGFFWSYKEDFNNEKVQKLKRDRDYLCNKEYLKRGKEQKNARSILQLDKEGNIIREFETVSSVKELGYDPSSIVKVCKGKAKTAYGYRWKYK